MQLPLHALKIWLRTAARIVLGLFVVWQLFFLFAANLWDLARETRDELPGPVQEVVNKVAPGWSRKEGALHEAVETLMTVTRRWAQLTGQPQDWALFVSPRGESIFLAVELRWDEDARAGEMPSVPELLLSENEPEDVHHFLRLGKFRLRRYEGVLALRLSPFEDETPAETNARWRDKIKALLRQEGDTVQTYLRWRLAAYRNEHPQRRKPRQLILQVRRYHIPDPREIEEFDWAGPFVEPLARWRPGVPEPEGYLPVERYNHVSGRFEWVPK